MAELTGGLVVSVGATSVFETTAKHNMGVRSRDISGNEYVYVRFTDANYAGGWAVLDGSYNATRVATTSRGAIGICQGSANANDYGWLKIYGIEDAAQLGPTDSEATSATGLIAPTGATSNPYINYTSTYLTSVVSGATLNPVFGAWSKAAASTATTASSSTFSGVTIQVFLNYPYLMGFTAELIGSS